LRRISRQRAAEYRRRETSNQKQAPCIDLLFAPDVLFKKPL